MNTDRYPPGAYYVLAQLGDTDSNFFRNYAAGVLWIYTPQGLVAFDVPFTEVSYPWESILLAIAKLDQPMGAWVDTMQWILVHRKNPQEWIATYETIVNSPLLIEKTVWLKSILERITSGKNGYEDLGMVQKAVSDLQSVVAPRVAKDKEQLRAEGLIGPNHILTGIEFSGADFHKNGKSVLFLHFLSRTSPTDHRRIVYKPSNLAVDALLVGTENSLAHLIDPRGVEIPQYKIIPMSDDLGDYGYMEFVTSANPTSQDDVKALARSIGATAAFSYLVGIHDLHHENVLLRQNRVQLIDVETTSGIFDSEWGFKQQVLDMGIKQFPFATFRTDLFPRLLKGAYVSLLRTEATGMFIKYLEHAVRIPEENLNKIFAELGKMRSRFLPIDTSMFYSLVPVAQRKTFPQWKTFVHWGRFDSAANGIDLYTQLLVAEETYNALHRGEIPFYWNDLGSTRIFDETGTQLALEHLLPPQMTRKPIHEEIAGRVTKLRDHGVLNSDGFHRFEHQIIPLFALSIQMSDKSSMKLAKFL